MTTKELIKQDLLNQLEENGVKGEQYKDLINDYIEMWEIKNKLIKDIKDRGVSIKWQNSETSFGYKKNDSISEALKTNGQMLKILHQLGLSPSQFEPKEIIPEM